MSKETKIDFEKPYPDEEKMRRGVLYWQNAPQERPEDRCKFYIREGFIEGIQQNLFTYVFCYI